MKTKILPRNNNIMKNIVLIITLCAFSFTNLANDKYEKAMLKFIPQVYQANSMDDHQAVINSLSRVANAEKDKWEPFYYIAYSYAIMAFKAEESVQKDKYLDLAQEQLDKGVKIAPEESELSALQGFIYTGRLVIDPMTRGPQFSGMASQVLQKAVKQNNQNPRALLLLGQMMYGTAQFMGGGTEDACAMIEKSLTQFDNYSSDNKLAPTWGKDQAEGALKQCGK